MDLATGDHAKANRQKSPRFRSLPVGHSEVRAEENQCFLPSINSDASPSNAADSQCSYQRGDGHSIGTVTPALEEAALHMNAKPTSTNTSGEAPRIRDFSTEDQTAVSRLIEEGLRYRWGSSYDSSYNPDLVDLWANYVTPGGQIVVALTSEPVIPRLRRISVSEDHRRKGLGRLVVQELFDRAAALGFTQALVSTDTPWTDAVALYQSCGFEAIYSDTEETHLLRRTAGC